MWVSHAIAFAQTRRTVVSNSRVSCLRTPARCACVDCELNKLHFEIYCRFSMTALNGIIRKRLFDLLTFGDLDLDLDLESRSLRI